MTRCGRSAPSASCSPAARCWPGAAPGWARGASRARSGGRTWPPRRSASIPSGHSTFSAAAAAVLARFTGSDRFGASATIRAGSSRVEPGDTPAADVVLSWPTFSDAADQAGRSRRYGGLHFRGRRPGRPGARRHGRGQGLGGRGRAVRRPPPRARLRSRGSRRGPGCAPPGGGGGSGPARRRRPWPPRGRRGGSRRRSRSRRCAASCHRPSGTRPSGRLPEARVTGRDAGQGGQGFLVGEAGADVADLAQQRGGSDAVAGLGQAGEDWPGRRGPRGVR